MMSWIKTGIVAIVAGAGLLAGCGVEVDEESLGTAEQAVNTLAVQVSGPYEADVAGSYPYVASVSGGSGQYHYTWYLKYCNRVSNKKYCSTTWTQVADGDGLSTIHRNIYSTDYSLTVHAEVTDLSPTCGAAGAGQFTTQGPLAGSDPTPVTPGYDCSTPNWCPL